MIDRVMDALSQVVEEVILVGADPRPEAGRAVRVVADRHPGTGPLGGLQAALTEASTPWCLVVACDMPLLNGAVLERLLARIQQTTAAAVIPHVSGFPQPLLAGYSCHCLGAIERLIQHGQLKMVDLFQEVQVDWMPAGDICVTEGSLWSFFNVNTPEQFRLAERYLCGELEGPPMVAQPRRMAPGERSQHRPLHERSRGGMVSQGEKIPLEGLNARGTAASRESGAEPMPLSAMLPMESYLAAIVAHELSNPFTALAGRVELMRNRKDLPAPLVRDLDAMRTASERVDRLLSNLKNFSRRESPPARPVELLPIVQNAVELFRATARGARVEVSVAPWDPAVRAVADPTLLEATLAATLEVITARSPLIHTLEVSLSVNAPDEEVSLLFRDQGPEITEEAVSRVFHPFGGASLSAWGGVITLAYGYYVIRAWGGTYRFRSEGGDMITELCLALQM